MEKPKIDRKRKFLYSAMLVKPVPLSARCTNPHLLGLAHAIHVGTIVRIASLLVDRAMAAHGLVDIIRAFVVHGHCLCLFSLRGFWETCGNQSTADMVLREGKERG